nr:MAG TPA: hypothetical protein [Caudoviricetes sp.]
MIFCKRMHLILKRLGAFTFIFFALFLYNYI